MAIDIVVHFYDMNKLSEHVNYHILINQDIITSTYTLIDKLLQHV